MKSTFLTLALLSFSAIADASCDRVTLGHAETSTIRAALNSAVHISLPEPITKDTPGNTGLWVFSGEGSHYWVKPGSDTKDGERTTLTLITASRSFDFVLVRVPVDAAQTCVVIEEPPVFGEGVIKPIAVSASHISNGSPTNTGYKFDSKRIASVFDDGRKTYIRLPFRSPGLSVPVLTGGTKKAPEIIPTSWDPRAMTFTVAGIHDAFTMVDGESSIAISRIR